MKKNNRNMVPPYLICVALWKDIFHLLSFLNIKKLSFFKLYKAKGTQGVV